MHEIKHDGYRVIARRTDDRVRLYTRRGFKLGGPLPYRNERLVVDYLLPGQPSYLS
jgi:ATP-dependent DNA ligase